MVSFYMCADVFMNVRWSISISYCTSMHTYVTVIWAFGCGFCSLSNTPVSPALLLCPWEETPSRPGSGCLFCADRPLTTPSPVRTPPSSPTASRPLDEPRQRCFSFDKSACGTTLLRPTTTRRSTQTRRNVFHRWQWWRGEGKNVWEKFLPAYY